MSHLHLDNETTYMYHSSMDHKNKSRHIYLRKLVFMSWLKNLEADDILNLELKLKQYFILLS